MMSRIQFINLISLLIIYGSVLTILYFMGLFLGLDFQIAFAFTFVLYKLSKF